MEILENTDQMSLQLVTSTVCTEFGRLWLFGPMLLKNLEPVKHGEIRATNMHVGFGLILDQDEITQMM